MSELRRRNVSGIFIFDKFPTDEERKPTCLEDCQPQTRREWCMAKDQEYLRNVIEELAETFHELTDFCLENGAIKPDWAEEFHAMMARQVERSKLGSVRELAERVDIVCDKIVLLADGVGFQK